ncbi:glycosyl hydrolase [Lyngbya aestuarii]|uniref:glycosyl hydrolase n=1 Tax=Lyngbya aestuarii TaxID=118322 RepID=UPI00403D9FC9
MFRQESKIRQRLSAVLLTGLAWLFMLLLLCQQLQGREKPANYHASREARALLGYLYGISSTRIISGQHNNPNKNFYTNQVFEITGKYPGLWGNDYRYGSWVRYRQKMTNEAIAQWKKGSLVTIMYHATRPMDSSTDGWGSVQGELSTAEWEELVTPGTPLHKRWLSQIDQVAFYLKQLRDAKVPVLWRPYHEMNGGWFWWGKKTGENGYKKLWKLMYKRYVNYHKLNNLIWVWNPNAPRDDADPYELYYPGDKYVDVLAADVYNNDYRQSHHDQLLKLGGGKPIALGEVGELPDPAKLQTEQPRWVWFMEWREYLTEKNDEDWIHQVYNHPFTLTLDKIDIPRL